MILYYEQHGQGPDVVLVHGWAQHGGIWTDVARALSAEFRVTVPDLPGHGRSRDFLPRAFTADALAEEVRRVLPGPATWVGWSLGGFVALAAVQSPTMHQDHVGSVTMTFIKNRHTPFTAESASSNRSTCAS